jgi:catechol 2,3-dioxygenase-like lactoylglutathione lyase family enzyme
MIAASVTLGAARLIATIPVRDVRRARDFYAAVLGLGYLSESAAGVLMATGDARLLLYESAGDPPGHTLAGFEVERLEPVMAALRSRGVTFEDYDYPTLHTVDQIAWIGPERAAWFRDSEGNILSISEPWREDVSGI